MARSMMIHARAPKSEWIYALRTASHILRRLPTTTATANPDRKVPIQMMANSNGKVSLAHLRTWYSPVFVVKQPPERSKSQRFEDVGWLGLFLGYKEGMKGYIVRINGKTYRRSPKHVYFIEDMTKTATLRSRLHPKDSTLSDYTTLSFTMAEPETETNEREHHQLQSPQTQTRTQEMTLICSVCVYFCSIGPTL